MRQRPGRRLATVAGALAAVWLTVPHVLAQGREAPASGEAQPRLVRAESDLVEAVLAESEVERHSGGVGWGPYVGYLAESFRRWVVLNLAQRGSGLVAGMGILAQVLIWSAVAVVVVWLGSWLLRRLRARRKPPQDTDVAAVPAPALVRRSGAQWHAELERRLETGHIPEVLEAVWWWLARSVAGSRVDESWTSRELAARAGRRDLAPHLATLDGMVFGVREPDLGEIHALVRRLEGLVS